MTAAAVIQRPLRGSRISTFYPVKNLPSLSSLDSAFQLQEYISLLIRLDVHDVEAITSLPGTSAKDREAEKEEAAKEEDKEDKKNDVSVDQACWIYEQLRRLAQDLSHPLITTLQQECTRASCPEMKAGEWLYLCVAHGNDGAMEQCCAIDYILHTVDSATALLNSPRTFPSRLQIPQTSHRHFSSLARRLGRIFAHAYFSHREAFEQAEAESSLYARFLALTSKFDLVPAEFLVIPSGHYGIVEEREPPRSITDPRFHYPTPPPIREPQTRGVGLAPKHLAQQALGIGRERSRSPNPPTVNESGGSPGSGEGSKRLGRNRTDTMVFADAEAGAIVDELAAKARAGELEPDDEGDGPKTAKPGEAGHQDMSDYDEDDLSFDSEDVIHPVLLDTQFEIPLVDEPPVPVPEPFGEETTSVPSLGEVVELQEKEKAAKEVEAAEAAEVAIVEDAKVEVEDFAKEPEAEEAAPAVTAPAEETKVPDGEPEIAVVPLVENEKEAEPAAVKSSSPEAPAPATTAPPSEPEIPAPALAEEKAEEPVKVAEKEEEEPKAETEAAKPEEPAPPAPAAETKTEEPAKEKEGEEKKEEVSA